MYVPTNKDMDIINSIHCKNSVILNIGCGVGDLDLYLCYQGHMVYATDLCWHKEWNDIEKVNYQKEQKLKFYDKVSILDIGTVPLQASPVVICSQVLEHLPDYVMAFRNLLKLCTGRLIVTFPKEKSYNVTAEHVKKIGGTPHCNFWSDDKTGTYHSVKEFVDFSRPHRTTISTCVAKERDIVSSKRYYLIIVDKDNS